MIKIYNGFCLGLFTLFFMMNNAFGGARLTPEEAREIDRELLTALIMVIGIIILVIWVIAFFVIKHIKKKKEGEKNDKENI